MVDEKIKSMKLYNFIDRIFNELKELGKFENGNLSIKELEPFDQLHYHGTEAIDFAIEKFNINKNSNVLEIGSGVGGPSRYLAYKTGANVIALELQKDHHEIGIDLTKRCGLEKNVTHLCGDFLEYDFEDQKFDLVASWLTLYHIPKRELLLKNCMKLLNNNGYFFAEDFAYHKQFSQLELDELSSDFFANYIVSYDDYKDDLVNTGFNEVRVEDVSLSWKKFTKDRFDMYYNNLERHIRVHNHEIVGNMLDFYSFAMRYLAVGKLGGIRVSAKK